MRPAVFLTVALLVVASLGAIVFATARSGPEEPAELVWRTDLDAAREEALRDGAPMLVVFR